MTPPREAARDSGMVLVEVLAALAIVALMGGLMAGFIGQLGTISGLGRDVAVRAELSAAAEHLRLTLEQARPVPLGIEADPERVFDGVESGARFVAVARRGFRALALRQVHVRTAERDGRRQLVETLGTVRPTPASAAEVVVIDDLGGGRFEYAGANGAFAPEWRSGELPAAVRNTLWRVADGRTLAVQTVARPR
jgi:hypothetical protein